MISGKFIDEILNKIFRRKEVLQMSGVLLADKVRKSSEMALFLIMRENRNQEEPETVPQQLNNTECGNPTVCGRT